MLLPLLSLLALLLLRGGVARQASPTTDMGGIEMYTLSNFPNSKKVAMHMPCPESNVFPTKCMCHLYCIDTKCSNAVDLCKKREGCKYIILRGSEQRRFATLKRTPTSAEMEWFSLKPFQLQNAVTPAVVPSVQYSNTIRIRDLVTRTGVEGASVLSQIFQTNISSATKHCGKRYLRASQSEIAAGKNSFLEQGVSLVALSYHAPRTLLNSMRSWNASGLLSWVAEKIIILNDPLPEELAIAQAFDFQVIQPRDIPNAKTAARNVLTIGAAFYYALQIISFDYLLFLENDLKMDLNYRLAPLDLLAGLGMLEQGIQVVRLQSRSYQGCGNFLSCEQAAVHIGMGEKKRFWYSYYCPGTSQVESHVSDCMMSPVRYRCFTSWDTNWSLNAALMKKSSMLGTKYTVRGNITKSIPEIGLAQFQQQDGLESVMVHSMPWAQWRVPICISLQGLFIHEEIETGS